MRSLPRSRPLRALLVLVLAVSAAAAASNGFVRGPAHPTDGDGRPSWGPPGPRAADAAPAAATVRPASWIAQEGPDLDAPDASIVDGSAARALAAARERWAAARIRDYRMRLRLSCFCRSGTTRARTVRVRGGRLVGTVPEHLRRYATVPRLFARIAEAVEARPARLTASYAPATGRPTGVAVDVSLRIADEETGVVVTGFRRGR